VCEPRSVDKWFTDYRWMALSEGESYYGGCVRRVPNRKILVHNDHASFG
jgi:hypothetical protein